MDDDSDVQVKFGAQIDGLVAGVSQAKDQISGLGETASGVADSFRGIGETIVSAFAVDKIGEAIEKYAELGEQIQHTAQITGLSTDDVQKFQFAVKMSGGDADSAAFAMQRFERNMAQAATGTGTAAQAYANLGVSVTDASGKIRPLSDVLEDVAEKFSHVQDGAIKVEYAIALGGRTFGSMIPYLDRGKAGLDELYKSLDQTGAKMSPEMVKSATDLAEHTKLLGSAWDGFAHVLEGAVTPAIDSWIQHATSQLETMTTEIALVAHASDIWKAYWASKNQGNGEWTGSAGSGGDWQGSTGTSGAPKDYGEQFGPQQQRTLPPLESGGIGKDKDTRDQEAKEATDTQIALSKLAFAQIVQDQDALVAQFKETEAQKIDAVKAAAELLNQTEQGQLDSELAKYSEDSLAYQQTLDKKKLLAAQFTLEMSKLDDQMAEANAKALKKTQEEYKSFFDTIDKSMDSMLQGILQGTQTWQQAMARLFDNLALSFIEDIAKMLIKAAALQAVNLAGGAGGNLSAAIGAGVPSALGGTQSNSANPLTAIITTLTTAITGNTAAQTMMQAVTEYNAAATQMGVPILTGLNTTTLANTTATLANTIAEAAGGGDAAIFGAAGAGIGAAGIPLFAEGTMSAPGGLSILHPGEIVIPAGASQAIRSGSASIGGAAGGGANISISLNAIDTQSGIQFLMQNMPAIAGGLATQVRNGNSAMTNAIKSLM